MTLLATQLNFEKGEPHYQAAMGFVAIVASLTDNYGVVTALKTIWAISSRRMLLLGRKVWSE